MNPALTGSCPGKSCRPSVCQCTIGCTLPWSNTPCAECRSSCVCGCRGSRIQDISRLGCRVSALGLRMKIEGCKMRSRRYALRVVDPRRKGNRETPLPCMEGHNMLPLPEASPEAHLKMSLMYSSAVRPSSAMKMSAILGTIDALPLRAAGLVVPML